MRDGLQRPRAPQVVPEAADARGWDGTGLVPAACARELINDYARSKLVAEHRLAAAAGRARVVIARVGLLDGPASWALRGV